MFGFNNNNYIENLAFKFKMRKKILKFSSKNIFKTDVFKKNNNFFLKWHIVKFKKYYENINYRFLNELVKLTKQVYDSIITGSRSTF